MASNVAFHKVCLMSPAFAEKRCQQMVCAALHEQWVAEEKCERWGTDSIEAVAVPEERFATVTTSDGTTAVTTRAVVVYIRGRDAYWCERVAAGLVLGLYMSTVSADAQQAGMEPAIASILRHGFDVRHERGLTLTDVEWAALWGRGGRQPASVN